MKNYFLLAIFLSIALLFLGGMFVSIPVQAATIIDGDLIRNPSAKSLAQFDVYIAKIVGTKKFKRLILSPHVFESYGHLSWDEIQDVGQATMDEYKTSDLVRCYDPEKGIDDPKVYRLIPDGDQGTKEHLDLTASEFEVQGYDWDSIYTINGIDRDAYGAEGEIKNTTFVKSYRMYDSNYGRGVWSTEDGNYIFVGSSLVGLQDDAFISKLNRQGQPIWTKLVGSMVHYSGPFGTGPADDVGYFACQLKDGSYLMAGQTDGYVGDAEAAIFETAIDVFLSKFSQDGKHLWTETVGDLAGDTPSGLWPTDDGGFLLLLALEELGAGAAEVGDTYWYFALAKFDQEGKKEWIKKTNLRGAANYIEREDDGGFVLIGEIPFDEVLKTEDEEIGSSMDTIVRLDKDSRVIWAKSIEAIPTEYLIPKPDGKGGYIESYMKARWAAGNFSAVQRTPDNGYLAIGFILPFVKGFADYGSTYETITGTPLLAVKLSQDGKFQWAKTITTGLYSFDNEFRLVKTKDNDFIIMRNFMSKGEEYMGEPYNIYMQKSEELAKLYQQEDFKPGDEEKNPALEKAIEERNKAQYEWAATMAKHVLLIKIDPEFNVKWAKTIGPEPGTIENPRQFTGDDIQIDNDEGIIIAGSYHTDIVSFISFGEKFYYTDALLIKLDANGDLADNSSGLVSEHSSVSQEDLSQYIVLRDLEPKIIDYQLGIKRQKPTVSSKGAKTITTLSPFKEKTVVLEEEEPMSSIPTPETTPKTKTWAEMNYEATETVEPVNERSRQLHNELLPILNQLFAGKVKLRDDFGGILLDYTFNRLVTRDDVVAVQEYLESVGYTTDTSEGGQLIVMKIGWTLNLNFSIKSKRYGTLEVTF